MNNEFERKWRENIASVVFVNEVAGKTAPFSDDDIDKQMARVDEESNELMGHIDTLINKGVDHEIMVKIMDDICDIAVTLSYQMYMSDVAALEVMCPLDEIEASGECHIELLSELLKNRNAPFVRMCTLMTVAKMVSETPDLINCQKFDVNEAFTLVNANNMSKFIPETHPDLEQITYDTFRKYEELGEQIYTEHNHGYVVFKRVSDDKFLKPSTFVDVDISSTVVV